MLEVPSFLPFDWMYTLDCSKSLQDSYLFTWQLFDQCLTRWWELQIWESSWTISGKVERWDAFYFIQFLTHNVVTHSKQHFFVYLFDLHLCLSWAFFCTIYLKLEITDLSNVLIELTLWSHARNKNHNSCN